MSVLQTERRAFLTLMAAWPAVLAAAPRRSLRVLGGLTIGAMATAGLATIISVSINAGARVSAVYGRFVMSFGVIAFTAAVVLPVMRSIARRTSGLSAVAVGALASPFMYLLNLVATRGLLRVLGDVDLSPSLTFDIQFALHAWPMTICWLIGMGVAAGLLYREFALPRMRSA